MNLLKNKMIIQTIVAILVLSTNSFAEEISTLPEGSPSSVMNIVTNIEKNVAENITSCIKDDASLRNVYEYDAVKEVINKKFNEASKCEDIIKELEGIGAVKKQVTDVISGAMCAENAPVENAEQKRKSLEDIYGKLSQEYSKFFAYDENLAKFEQCISFYANAATFISIKAEEDSQKFAIREKRGILSAHGLLGFYGENKGSTGSDIVSMINDIENKNISIKEVKGYAIIEDVKEKWELSGAMVGYLIYTFKDKYIAIPLIKGISYSCDKLSYTIFKFEKKIEIPEKDYIVYLLEPLE